MNIYPSGPGFDKTKHSDGLYIGLALHPKTGKRERYLLKFFPRSARLTKNAIREVLFSYIFVEAGMAMHAPKIGAFTEQGLTFVIRRFYKGMRVGSNAN